MNQLEAIKARHSVRSYKEQMPDSKCVDKLCAMIDELNHSSGLHMQLLLDEPRAFSSIKAHYGKFAGVKNYIALIGPKTDNLEEICGYNGEKLVLAAQQMGLNTCWVAGTYKKIPDAYHMEKGERIVAVIVIGYGTTDGKAHKSKSPEQVTEVEGTAPEWFYRGVDAALLAPTAINQQRFRFSWKNGEASVRSLLGPCSKLDLGIVKLHFEIGSGKVFSQMNTIVVEPEWDLHDRYFSEIKMYQKVEAVAKQCGLVMTEKALPYMKEAHKGQTRKGKEHIPYIYHPLMMCCHALALGIREDEILAAILLHDVCEDCGILPEELPVSKEVQKAVSLLTFTLKEGQELHDAQVAYCQKISENRIALLIKILDRCNNISTMAIGFSKEQMGRYIKNTEEFIFPLLERLKRDYPQHYDHAFLLKYQIVSLLETFKRLI